MLDINAKAEIGKSLAGLKLGNNLSMYLPYVDQIVDEHQVEWTIDIELDNKGILLYKFKDDESILYFSEPRLELVQIKVFYLAYGQAMDILVKYLRAA